MTQFDELKRILLGNEKYFRNYLAYAKKIAKKLLKDDKVRVIVFGSVVRANYTPDSDIDLLIISEKAPTEPKKISDLTSKMLEAIQDIYAPFEIHLVKPKVYESWYKRFIGDNYIEV